MSTRVTLIQTSPDGHWLRTCDAPAFVPDLENWYGGQAFVLNPAVRYQTMVGFGGSFTEAATWALAQLEDEASEAVLRAYFDPRDGLGYSIGRTHINSCDFSLENWACADVADDWSLEHFNLRRTEQYILPALRRANAIAEEPIKMFASPWSPPAWMKTNGEMNNGGKLKPECRQVWADHYARWIHEVEAAGVPIWGLTVQNEPAAVQVWDSCIYTAAEERDFVRDYLGPALRAAGLGDKKLVVWDHNRELAFERGATVLSDPEAAQYVWGTGVHWYSGDYFDQLEQLMRAFPDKHVMFTEGCWEGGVKLGQWDRGTRYAHHMIGDLNHGCVAWCDWNLALDHTGGPNHVNNLCDAPVIVDTRSGEVHYQTSFAFIGHFSRYIRPGATRIGLSYIGGGLEATAFANPDGSDVLVVHNPTPEAVTYRALHAGGGVELTIPAASMHTAVFQQA